MNGTTSDSTTAAGNLFQNINDQSSHQPSTKLSPTKTLIQKFNSIGSEPSSNTQTEKQKHIQAR